jgi:hypothetical protein
MTGKGGKAEQNKAQQRAARNARLSAALRENLKRRKAQARGRVANHADQDAALGTEDAAPPSPDFRRIRGRD